MSDEGIFREVDEELRRQQLKEYWNKYGLYIIAVAIAIVVSVAGYKGWQFWSARQAAEAGSNYSKAQTLADEGKSDAAAKLYSELAENGPKGYRVLSRLRLAASEAAAGQTDNAVKILDALVANSNSDDVFQGFARIQAAMMRLDEAGYDEMVKRLGAMTAANNSWRHSARELLGLSAYKAGRTEDAEKLYNEVIADREAPRNLRRRVEMMLALIVEASAGQASEVGAAGAGK